MSAGDMPHETRCGFVTLIGPTNAGKSTLLNRMVGAKVSIVSHKVQTTRALVRGIVIHDRSQIIFVDTPGIFRPRRRLDRAMIGSAWSGAGDGDLVLLVVDARKGLDAEIEDILRRLKDTRQPRFLVLNKIDAMAHEALLPVSAAFNAAVPFAATFMVSALEGDGVGDLLHAVAAALPPGPWLYPEDEISDVPMRQLAAEITREALTERLHQELPYESTVETESWAEQKDGSVRIDQVIYVTRDSQRAIVLGKGGQTIKAIGRRSREQIAAILEVPVHLFLFVKVREAWADDPQRYREMGLEFPNQ